MKKLSYKIGLYKGFSFKHFFVRKPILDQNCMNFDNMSFEIRITDTEDNCHCKRQPKDVLVRLNYRCQDGH